MPIESVRHIQSREQDNFYLFIYLYGLSFKTSVVVVVVQYGVGRELIYSATDIDTLRHISCVMFCLQTEASCSASSDSSSHTHTYIIGFLCLIQQCSGFLPAAIHSLSE